MAFETLLKRNDLFINAPTGAGTAAILSMLRQGDQNRYIRLNTAEFGPVLGFVRVSPTPRPESDRDFSYPVVFGHRNLLF